MIRNASVKAISDAKIGSNTLASTCSPSAPIARLVAAHAELHRSDEARRIGHDPHDRAGPAVALLRELLDPRPARRDEPVLGRHEIGVQQDQRRDAEEFQEKGHAPALRRARSTRPVFFVQLDLRRSIGNAGVVTPWAGLGPPGQAVPGGQASRRAAKRRPLASRDGAEEREARPRRRCEASRPRRRRSSSSLPPVVLDDLSARAEGSATPPWCREAPGGGRARSFARARAR